MHEAQHTRRMGKCMITLKDAQELLSECVDANQRQTPPPRILSCATTIIPPKDFRTSETDVVYNKIDIGPSETHRLQIVGASEKTLNNFVEHLKQRLPQMKIFHTGDFFVAAVIIESPTHSICID